MVISSSKPEDHRKQCTICGKPRDVLVRCQIDSDAPSSPARPASTSPPTSNIGKPPSPHSSNSSTSLSQSRSPSPSSPLEPEAEPSNPQHQQKKWHFICPSPCWTQVSGGVIDGDKSRFPGYRYGGMWKNKHAGVSAKKPKRKNAKNADGRKKSNRGVWRVGAKYVVNDRVEWGVGERDGEMDGEKGKAGVWVCRKSHVAREGEEPGVKVAFWKEDDRDDRDEDRPSATGDRDGALFADSVEA